MSHFPFKMDQQFFSWPHCCHRTGKMAAWHIWRHFKQLVQFVASHHVGLGIYGNTKEHKPHRSKLPIAGRRVRQNDPHPLLHLAAITFVPQEKHTRVPFVSRARPPLQGAHAPVVLIHVQFGSLDSDHPGQNRTSKKTAPEDQVYYLASPGAMSKLNKATISLLFDFLSCAPFNLHKTNGIY